MKYSYDRTAAVGAQVSSNSQRLALTGRGKVAGAFDSENKTQLSALKKHVKAALEGATKAKALVIELEKAASGNKGLERRFDRYRSEVSEAVSNFEAMYSRLERELDED